MSDVDEFLRSSRQGRYPQAKFDKIGDRAGGVIVGLPRVITTQYGKAMIVDLQNESAQGGGYTWWCGEGTQASGALAEAVGDQGLAEGGKLEVTFTDTRDTGKPSPLKVYEVVYEAPVRSVDPSSIFGNKS